MWAIYVFVGDGDVADGDGVFSVAEEYGRRHKTGDDLEEENKINGHDCDENQQVMTRKTPSI